MRTVISASVLKISNVPLGDVGVKLSVCPSLLEAIWFSPNVGERRGEEFIRTAGSFAGGLFSSPTKFCCLSSNETLRALDMYDSVDEVELLETKNCGGIGTDSGILTTGSGSAICPASAKREIL